MNRDKLGKMSLIDLLHTINMSIEDCLYQVLTNCTDEQKRSRCVNKKCYDCMSEYLNEGGRKLYIGKEWMEPCEVNALVTKLKEERDEYKNQLSRAKVLLMQIRAYFGTMLSWEMYEEEVQAIIGEEQADGNTN